MTIKKSNNTLYFFLRNKTIFCIAADTQMLMKLMHCSEHRFHFERLHNVLQHASSMSLLRKQRFSSSFIKNILSCSDTALLIVVSTMHHSTSLSPLRSLTANSQCSWSTFSDLSALESIHRKRARCSTCLNVIRYVLSSTLDCYDITA